MNVKAIIGLLKDAKKIMLGYGASAVPFDKNDMLQMSAYGDYAVESIEGGGDGYYEVNIRMTPVKGVVA